MKTPANLLSEDVLAPHIRRWNLTPLDQAFRTRSSWLQPVRAGEVPAMLKVPTDPEERKALPMLPWFAGDGAAQVLRWDDGAQLVEWLPNAMSLTEMAERDTEATRILCRVVAALHRPRSKPAPDCAIPIRRRFRELAVAAATPGPHQDLFAEAWSRAQDLIAGAGDVTILHGDIHHENIRRAPDRGWRAIDPKGVIGPRAYDYANILDNPTIAIAERPGRFRAQAGVIAKEAGLDLRDVIGWGFAHAALSACWSFQSGQSGAEALAVAAIARAEIKAMEVPRR